MSYSTIRLRVTDGVVAVRRKSTRLNPWLCYNTRTGEFIEARTDEQTAGYHSVDIVNVGPAEPARNRTAGDHPPIPTDVAVAAAEAASQAYLKRAYDEIEERFGSTEGCGGVGRPSPCGGCKDCAGAQLAAYMPVAEYFADQATAVLQAAAPILWRAWTEGRAVVEKPEPDDTDEDGHPVWSLPGEHGGDELIAIAGDFGPPFVLVSSTCEMLQAASARHRGASFLAAADRAEQLARQQANKDDPTGSGREPAARAPVQREGRAAGFEGDIRPDGETYNAARDPNVGQELQRTCDALGITAEQARAALLQRHEAILRDAEEVSS